MGNLGMSEMIFIFVLALLIFGPKKLPELGKTLGRAMTEFRRASSELKSTFDREMNNLERETASTTKELNSGFSHDNSTYNYESTPYDPDSYSYHETNPYTASASAPEGAQLTAATTEVDGSMFVSALEGTPHPSEAPKSPNGAHGTSESHPAV